MRKLIIAIVVVGVCGMTAAAQSKDSRRGWGYVFAGAGAVTDDGAVPLIHLGGGGEGLIHKGFGVGAEIGYLAAVEESSEGAGLFSANVAYHFNGDDPSRKVSPFVTGGYSVVFRDFASHGGNFGGGVQWWVRDRVALRFEFRDHIFSSDSPHVVMFRFGVSFR
jgi:hypothetical protein